jgi:hypothetical protein
MGLRSGVSQWRINDKCEMPEQACEPCEWNSLIFRIQWMLESTLARGPREFMVNHKVREDL